MLVGFLWYGYTMTNTTSTEITKWAADALRNQDGVKTSSLRFGASNGVNYTDKSYDLPDGSHLELLCISPMGACRYEWRLYSPVGTIVERNAPMAVGFYGGRYSDYMRHVMDRYNRIPRDNWRARDLFAKVYNGGVVPSEQHIQDQIDRGARNRAGAR